MIIKSAQCVFFIIETGGRRKGRRYNRCIIIRNNCMCLVGIIYKGNRRANRYRETTGRKAIFDNFYIVGWYVSALCRRNGSLFFAREKQDTY